MIQQEIGVEGFGDALTNIRKVRRRQCSGNRWSYYDPTLQFLYEIIMGWPSLPLLFARGAGKVKANGRGAGEIEKKTQKPRKKRRKFGDEEDDEDEPYIPKVRPRLQCCFLYTTIGRLILTILLSNLRTPLAGS